MKTYGKGVDICIFYKYNASVVYKLSLCKQHIYQILNTDLGQKSTHLICKPVYKTSGSSQLMSIQRILVYPSGIPVLWHKNTPCIHYPVLQDSRIWVCTLEKYSQRRVTIVLSKYPVEVSTSQKLVAYQTVLYCDIRR